jgi:hypothetical protein
MKSVGSISLFVWITVVSVGCEPHDNIVGDVLFHSGNNPLEQGEGSQGVGGSGGVTTVTTSVTGGGGSSGNSGTKTLSTGGTMTVVTTGGVGGTTPLLSTPPSTNPTGCSEKTDFVEIAAKTATKNRVEPESNGCKIAGAFYAFGDTTGTLKQPLPLANSTTDYASPCTDEGCCIAGTTSLWTLMSPDGLAPTYAEWGAGLRFTLNDLGAGGATSAYAGPVKGFTFKTAGVINLQTVDVKVYHTSGFTTEMPPLVEMPELGTWTVKFTDATCENYPYREPYCNISTPDIYEIDVQVEGGEFAGDFKLCITSLTPIF